MAVEAVVERKFVRHRRFGRSQRRNSPLQDKFKAAERYQQACAMSGDKGCSAVGRAALRAGLSAGLCGGVAKGCDWLGQAYASGEGVPRDDTKAARLCRKGCDEGYAASCFHLGVAHFQGVGVDRDAAKAAQLFQQACDVGTAAACFNLGLVSRGAVCQAVLRVVDWTGPVESISRGVKPGGRTT